MATKAEKAAAAAAAKGADTPASTDRVPINQSPAMMVQNLVHSAAEYTQRMVGGIESLKSRIANGEPSDIINTELDMLSESMKAMSGDLKHFAEEWQASLTVPSLAGEGQQDQAPANVDDGGEPVGQQ